ncbi:unnamed protein product [Parnassius apollo]|uniref:(apollo) hypothetical protein n=1 Tax=Parnassius apollo TaxID=110799 RepID=A0A8S3W221_PARAO|nr:unnamed protein product [Parnassius apollo]
MHHESATSETSEKPEVIGYYNSTKAGVDAVDQMCHSYSCSRRTKRWPLAIFYNMLDVAGINSHTILNNNNNRNGKNQESRAEFLYKLSLDLMLPYIKDRLKIPNLRHKIRDKIQSVISEHRKLHSDNQGTLSGTSIRRVDNTESLRDL